MNPTPFERGIALARSSQKKRRHARKKRAEHCGADDTLPNTHRAVLLSTRRRRVRRGGSGNTGPAPGVRLALSGEVNGRGRSGGGKVGVQAGGDEHGTAARADGRRVWRRERHVVLRVQRTWDVAC